MVNKLAQSDRIAAEIHHAPLAGETTGRAASIMGRYRLQPDELPGGRHTGRIHSINTQGVEVLTPLAYITGLTKPLALCEVDVQTLVRMSDSPFAGDWIGRTVEVRTVRVDEEPVLRLFAPGAIGSPVDAAPAPHPDKRRGVMTGLAFIVILIVVVLRVLFVEQEAVLASLLEQLLSSFSSQ